MVSNILIVIKMCKMAIYMVLAVVLACNIYGVEMIFGFFVPDILISPEKEGDVKFFIDESVLKYTLAAVVLEMADNIVTLLQPSKI